MESIDYAQQLLHVVQAVARTFSNCNVSTIDGALNGRTTELVCLSFPPAACLYFVPSPHFPEAPPIAIIQWDNGDDRECFAMHWPFEGTPEQKLKSALDVLIASSENYGTAYGLVPTRPLTHDPEIAKVCGWRRLLTGAPIVASSSEIARARMEPALVDALASANILMVGLGSVGSYMAEQFARGGVGRLGLLDNDVVEDGNLSRTCYDRGDVGKEKAVALAARLWNISPDLKLNICNSSFQKTQPEVLRQLFLSADLVIAATDDPTAQAHVNSCSQFANKPAFFVGLYRGAKGGEVSISVPGITPCFRCQIGATRIPSSGGGDVRREVDYGSGRLKGEVALACDIQHVSSAAIKLALSLIAELKQVDVPLRKFAYDALLQEKHFLTMGMEPDWWFYPEVFRDVPGQFAFQSVWLTARRDASCPDCGSDRTAGVDPFTSMVTSIDASRLRGRFGPRHSG